MAGRPQSPLGIQSAIYGAPTALGVLTTAGASITNAATAVPFILRDGSVLRLVSDLACVVNIGGTASNVITSASYGMPLVAGVPLILMLPESATQISVMAAAAVNVNVATMA